MKRGDEGRNDRVEIQQIKNGVADLKPRILDRAPHPMMAAGASERDEMRSGFHYPLNLAPKRGVESNLACIPRLPHKSTRSAAKRSVAPILRWGRTGAPNRRRIDSNA